MEEVNTEPGNETLFMNALKGLKAIHEEVQAVNGLIRLSNESESHMSVKYDAISKTLSTIDGNILVINELLTELAESTKAIRASCTILMTTSIRLLDCLEKLTNEKGSV